MVSATAVSPVGAPRCALVMLKYFVTLSKKREPLIIAAAVSPPPIIVVASNSANTCANLFVPSANAANSATPTVPFHITTYFF